MRGRWEPALTCLVVAINVKTWKDQCTIWCRSHNLTGPYSVQEFVAAAVACGVKYSPLENFPHDLAIGVAHYGRVGMPWRPALCRVRRSHLLVVRGEAQSA
jgi:hypothetical protein